MVLRGINESFDIDDMDNDIATSMSASKQSVRKQSKIYDMVKSFIDDHKGIDMDEYRHSISDEDYQFFVDMENYGIDDDTEVLIRKSGMSVLFQNGRIFYLMNRIIEYVISQKRSDFENSALYGEMMDVITNRINKIASRKDVLYAYYKVKDRDELKRIVHSILYDVNNFNWIDVTGIINMTGLCESLHRKKLDISLWDVSNVRYMTKMFSYAHIGGLDISKWDVGNVTNMSFMFQRTRLYGDERIDFSKWNVSKVRNMSAMFTSCDDLILENSLRKWDVSSVKDMSCMFQSSNFNGDISIWDVSNVVDMTQMFFSSGFNRPISGWDVSNVTSMEYMFSESDFNRDISRWNVLGHCDISHMFHHCSIRKSFIPKRLTMKVNESFEIEDMGNDITPTPSVKKKVVKKSRVYMKFEKLVNDYNNIISEGYTRQQAAMWLPYMQNSQSFVGGREIYLERQGLLKDLYDGLYDNNPDIMALVGDDRYFRASYILNMISKEMPYKDGNRINEPRAGNREYMEFEMAYLFDIHSKDHPLYAIYRPKDYNELRLLIHYYLRSDYVVDYEYGKNGIDKGSRHYPCCQNLNWIDVSGFTDLGSLFTMGRGFDHHAMFEGDVSLWDVSDAVSMRGMFHNCRFNGDISKWDVSNVNDMCMMFAESYFNGDISGWDVSNVQNMSYMFQYAHFNNDISGWDVHNVRDMRNMFETGLVCTCFNGDLSGWDVSNVENMESMFKSCDEYEKHRFNGDISRWDVRKVKDMGTMFFNSAFNRDISLWQINPGCNTDWMFRECDICDEFKPAATQGLNESFDINDLGNDITGKPVRKRKVAKQSKMYKKMKDYVEEYMRLSNKGVDRYEIPKHLINDPRNETREENKEFFRYIYDNIDDLDDVRSLIDENGCHDIILTYPLYMIVTNIPHGALYVKDPRYGNAEYAEFSQRYLQGIKSKEHPLYAIYKPKDNRELMLITRYCCLWDASLNIVNDGVIYPYGQNLNWLDVSECTDMSSLFYRRHEYNGFNGDISLWDTYSVTKMSSMFMCSKFNGDISGWNVGNVKDMRQMFDNSIFDGDISGWNVSNVEDMYCMFRSAKFNGDISGWDVSSVRNMCGMFSSTEDDACCFKGDISDWDVHNVEDMSFMFHSTKYRLGGTFNGDISRWDVSSVKDISKMFYGSNFNGDISNWNPRSLTRADYMFGDSDFMGDLKEWDLPDGFKVGYMFWETDMPDENHPLKLRK